MFQFPFFVFLTQLVVIFYLYPDYSKKMFIFCLSPPFCNSVFARAVKRPPPIVGEAPGGARTKVEEPTRDQDSSAKTGDQYFWYFLPVCLVDSCLVHLPLPLKVAPIERVHLTALVDEQGAHTGAAAPRPRMARLSSMQERIRRRTDA